MASQNLAQIIPDTTLENENSVLTKDATINQGQIVDLIEGGADREDTLFHSFEEFNVLTDQQVYFANPSGIDNIVTRVTGSNASNILGKLGVDGSANLFLLNPNGILFGENASLDVRSSFLATTAESFVFDNDVVYDSTNPETPPLLEINIPTGLQFGASAGTIEVQGTGHQLDFDAENLTATGNLSSSGLEVPQGNTLALIGGELNLNGGNLTASEGTIELAAIAQSGEVELEQENDALVFNYAQIDNFQNINLFEQSSIDVRGGKNLGNVNLRGHDITLQDGSVIIANKSSPGESKTSGEINLIATDSLNITNDATGNFPSGIFTQNEQSSNKPGIDIDIKTNSLKLQSNAFIVSTVIDKGRGGNINIDAQQIDLIDNLEMPNGTGIYSQALSGAKGDVGIITVETDDLQLLDGQTIIPLDDEDDLEDVIGEDRSENLEDLIEDNEDDNVIIGAEELEKRTLTLQGGGQITSINKGSGEAGVAIIVAETVQLLDAPEPEEPEVEEPELEIPELEPEPEPEVEEPELEIPELEPEPEPEPEIEEPELEIPEPEPEPEVEVEVEEPELEIPEPEPEPEVEVEEPELEIPEPEPEVEVEEPELEIPEPEPEPEIEEPEVEEPEVEEPEPEVEEPELETPESEETNVFNLSNDETLVVNAEELNKIVQNDSTDSENEAVDMFINGILTPKSRDPNFDFSSACRIDKSNFMLVGKGGLAENPFDSVIQSMILPDLETRSLQRLQSISSAEPNHNVPQIDSVVEAQNWKINQAGKVELLAADQQTSSNAIADLPVCLQNFQQ